MFSYSQSAFFVVASMAVSMFVVAVLNRLWPISSRKLVNDVTGWQLGILGTTYGVILGFMLFTVWTDFREAEVNANLEASSLMTRRNLREEEFRNRLPGILWLLLVAGAGATVGSACLLGNDNKWLHYCQVMALTFVVAVTLAAIADLARPFEGAVSVSPVAFQRALALMQ